MSSDIVEIAGQTSEASRELLKVARKFIPVLPKLSTIRKAIKKPSIINSPVRSVIETNEDIILFYVISTGYKYTITVLFNPIRVGIEGNSDMLNAIAKKVAGTVFARTANGDFFEIGGKSEGK